MNPNSYLRNDSNALASGGGEPKSHYTHPLHSSHPDNAVNASKAGKRLSSTEQQVPFNAIS